MLFTHQDDMCFLPLCFVLCGILHLMDSHMVSHPWIPEINPTCSRYVILLICWIKFGRILLRILHQSSTVCSILSFWRLYLWYQENVLKKWVSIEEFFSLQFFFEKFKKAGVILQMLELVTESILILFVLLFTVLISFSTYRSIQIFYSLLTILECFFVIRYLVISSLLPNLLVCSSS